MPPAPSEPKRKRLSGRHRCILAIFFALVLATIAWFDITIWAGERAWKAALADYRSHGESLDLSTFFPAPIPDDENYAAIPLLRGITIPDNKNPSSAVPHPTRELLNNFYPPLYSRWPQSEHYHFASGPFPDLRRITHSLPRPVPIPHRDPNPYSPDATQATLAAFILSTLDSKFAALFAESDAAASQPRSQYIPHQIHHDALPDDSHLEATSRFAQILAIRASAAIHSNDPKTAAVSILAILKLLQAEDTPAEYAYTDKATLQLVAACTALRDGIAARVFDAPTLGKFQAEFASIDRIASYATALRIGVIEYSTDINDIKRHGCDSFGTGNDHFFFPDGWVDQNRALFLEEAYRSAILPVDARDFASHKNKGEILSARMKKMNAGFFGYRWYPAKLHLGFLFDTEPFYQQSIAHQAQLACALDLHFLDHQTYPNSLRDLVPDYIQSIPEDPIDRQPMRYQTTTGGHYILHSIGWNQTDENADPTKDWLWSHIPIPE